MKPQFLHLTFSSENTEHAQWLGPIHASWVSTEFTEDLSVSWICLSCFGFIVTENQRIFSPWFLYTPHEAAFCCQDLSWVGWVFFWQAYFKKSCGADIVLKYPLEYSWPPTAQKILIVTMAGSSHARTLQWPVGQWLPTSIGGALHLRNHSAISLWVLSRTNFCSLKSNMKKLHIYIYISNMVFTLK